VTNGPLAPADWYPDPEAPAGHLRYWDGYAWTEHRVAPPVAASDQTVGTAASSTSSSATEPSWFLRHKVLSAVFALLLLGWSVEAVSGSTDDPPPDSDQGSNVATGEGTSSQDDLGSEDDSAEKNGSDQPKRKTRTFRVVHVVDGDTVNLGNGKTVRLAGIDAPEVGECGYKRARNTLKGLVLGQRVSLGRSDEDHDKYGRLLRYIDVGSTDAGLRLIKDGLAIARYDSRDGYGFHPREPKYIKADRASPAYACAPKPVPLVAQPQQQKNCAPGYSPCIRPYPPDLDCPDIGRPVRVTGSDPHGLDRDGDGIACEWG
jgi:endonuclease YncB( thermonuclease family)